MSLYRAKTLVTHDEILRQPGDTFEVSPEVAAKNGWDRDNATVEPVTTGEYVPEAPAPEPTPAPEQPASAPDQTTEAPAVPDTTIAPDQSAASADATVGEGNTSQA